MKDIAQGIMRVARDVMAIDRVNEICRLLFESRDATHLWHLQTDSYAMHKALNAYYDGILELADSFLESAQGLFGRMKGGYRAEVADYKNAEQVKDHLTELRETLGQHSTNFPNELQNVIDEMMALIDQTLYLLTLK
jgi:hypothetical protein